VSRASRLSDDRSRRRQACRWRFPCPKSLPRKAAWVRLIAGNMSDWFHRKPRQSSTNQTQAIGLRVRPQTMTTRDTFENPFSWLELIQLNQKSALETIPKSAGRKRHWFIGEQADTAPLALRDRTTSGQPRRASSGPHRDRCNGHPARRCPFPASARPVSIRGSRAIRLAL